MAILIFGLRFFHKNIFYTFFFFKTCKIEKVFLLLFFILGIPRKANKIKKENAKKS